MIPGRVVPCRAENFTTTSTDDIGEPKGTEMLVGMRKEQQKVQSDLLSTHDLHQTFRSLKYTLM